MRSVRRMEDQISHILDSAIDLAMDAIEYKMSDPELSRTYHEAAKNEMESARRLNDQGNRRKEDARRGANGMEIPQKLQEEWRKRERNNIGKMERAKTYIDMYR